MHKDAAYNRALQGLAEELARRADVSEPAARALLLEATAPRCEGQCKRARPHGPFWVEAHGRGLRVTFHTCEAP